MSMAHITHSTTDNTESPLSTYHGQEAQQQTLKRCGWSKLNDHSSSIPLRSISVWLWSPIRLLTFSCPGASRDIFSAQPQFTPALWRVSLHGKYPIRMLVTSPPSSLFMVWLRSVGSEISFYCTATDFENLWRFWLCQQNIVCSDSVGQKLDQIGGKKYKETSRVLKWNLFLISWRFVRELRFSQLQGMVHPRTYRCIFNDLNLLFKLDVSLPGVHGNHLIL